MDHVEYIYTGGLSAEESRARLESAEVGVLAFARRGDSYAIPMAHVLDGDRLLFRFGDDPESWKMAYAAETITATFTVYEYGDPEDSWSVLARGPIEQTDLHPDDATLNELFPPFRLFNESIDDLTYDIYELRIEELTGRESLTHEE